MRADAIASVLGEVGRAAPDAHYRDLLLGAYGGEADPALPADHPRRRVHPFRMGVLAYDRFPAQSLLRRLYEWDALTDLIAAILGEPELHRCADPLLSCNVTLMAPGGQHGWHFDGNDFVVTILLQAAERGGAFEFAPAIRTDADQNYPAVARVMAGDPTLVRRPAVAARHADAVPRQAFPASRHAGRGRAAEDHRDLQLRPPAGHGVCALRSTECGRSHDRLASVSRPRAGRIRLILDSRSASRPARSGDFSEFAVLLGS